MSIDVADRLRPADLAKPLLAQLSLLDPNGIPLQIITAPTTVAYLNAHRGGDAVSDSVNAHQARDGLMCLARSNIADIEGGSDTDGQRQTRHRNAGGSGLLAGCGDRGRRLTCQVIGGRG